MKCIRYSKIISSTKKKSYMNVIYMQFQHLWKNSSRSLTYRVFHKQTNKAAYECDQLASKQFYDETSILI